MEGVLTDQQPKEVAEEAGNNSRDESNEDSDDDMDDPELLETFDKVVEAFVAAAKNAFPSSPKFQAAPPSEFQSFWKDVYATLASSIAADARIPEKLTAPWTKQFTITLFRLRHSMSCPCCLPSVAANVILRDENGVDKADFVRELADYLYGDSTLPLVYIDDSNQGGDGIPGPEDAMAVLPYAADWMSSLSKRGGERRAYVRYVDDEQVPGIYVYCCKPEEFEEKSQEKEQKAEKKRETKYGTK